MEKIQGYLEPIDAALVAKAKTNKESFGANIQIHGKDFPDLKQTKLVFFGLDADADLVRTSLYPLMWKFENAQVADLGNIVPPKNERERTYIIEEIIADLAKKNADQTCIGRNGKLRDLEGPVMFLASPASDYVTGQVLFVDGGFTAK